MRAELLALSLVLSPMANAAEMASSFIIDEADIAPAPARVQTAQVSNAPAAATSSTTATAPMTTQGTGRGCIPSRPYKESTPFRVFVDQINQTMTVHSPDFPEPLVFPVSTGGNLKVPDPASNVAPYCAETPEISRRIITAFESSEFEGRRDCSEQDVRGRSTLFPGNLYRSGQFRGQTGEGVLMPNAIRVRGGIFIHRCVGDACNDIGKPVSGECIRVPGFRNAPVWAVQAAQQNRLDNSAIAFKVNRYRRSSDDRVVSVPQIEISETLAKQMKKYGAIDVEVGPPPPMRPRTVRGERDNPAQFAYPTRRYCDQTDVDKAKLEVKEGKTPEGGFFNEIGGFFETLFGGSSRPSGPSVGGAPTASGPTQQQPQRRRSDPEWTRRVWGDY